MVYGFSNHQVKNLFLELRVKKMKKGILCLSHRNR